MTFLAILSWDDNNRAAKFEEFATSEDADLHIEQFIGQFPGAFSVPMPVGSHWAEWLVDPIAKTIGTLPLPGPTKFFVTYEEFTDRLTDAEHDAMGEVVYETDPVTNKPKNVKLMLALAYFMSINNVDLLHAKTDSFLSALVSAGAVTSARKTAILDYNQ